MRKGTRVGDAYVKVTADGDGMNEDIVDDLDDAGKDIDKKGDEQGESYGDHFSEGFEKRLSKHMGKVFNKALKKNMGEMDRSLDAMTTRIALHMEDALNRSSAKMGKRIGKSLGKSISKSLREELGNTQQTIGGMIDDLENRIGAVSRNRPSPATTPSGPGQASVQFFDMSAQRFAEKFEAARVRLHAQSNDTIEKDDRDLLKSQQDFLDRLMKDEKARADFIGRFEAERVKMHAKSNDAIEKDDESLRRSQQRLFDNLLRMAAENAHVAERFADARVRAQQKSNDAIEKDDRALAKAQQRIMAQALAAFEKDRDEAFRINKRMDDAIAKARAKSWADSANAHSKFLRDYEKDWADAYRHNRKLEAAASKTRIKDWQRLGVQMESAIRMNDKYNKGLLDGNGLLVSRNKQGFLQKDPGDMMGSLFGKGSRNNFLNVMGSLIGGITTGVVGMGKAAFTGFKMFSDGAKQATDMASQAGESISFLSKMAGGFRAVGTGMMSGIARSGPAAILAIAAVIVAASALSSVLMGLLMIVTSLVSTIASGLVGAIAIALPFFGAIVAAAGLATLAIMSMTNKQQQAFKDAFTPFKEEMTGIAQLMLGPIVNAFGAWSRNLQAALQPLAQYARGIGLAFADAGRSLTASFAAPGSGFQMLLRSLGIYLPGIIRNLSTALGGFLNGMFGMFSALMPFVARFARYLGETATRFATWATSAQGQNSIVNFVTRALASLRALWGFVKQVGGLLGDIFFNPRIQRAGNDMFGSMTREVGRMRDAFRRASADGSLQRWLDSAKRFGKALWAVIKSLIGVFDYLARSGMLDAISSGMEGMARGISIVTQVAEVATSVVNVMSSVMGSVLGPIGSVVSHLLGLANTARQVIAVMNMIPGVDVGGGGGGSVGGGGSFGWSPPRGVTRDGHGRSYSTGRNTLRTSPGRSYSIPSLTSMGSTALSNTYENDGGYMPDPDSGGTPNYAAQAARQRARERAAERRRRAAEMRRAIREANKTAQESIRTMKNTKSMADFRGARSSAMDALDQTGRRGKRARRVFRNLTKVNESRGGWLGSVDEQDSPRKIRQMVNSTNSLGTIIYARQRITARLEKANQKLADALALKSEYKKAIKESVEAYGGILTAEAQTLNGVTQALTAGDITANLQKRLDKIKQFNSNMQILLANGLNKAAYKQLMDGGVEGSSDAASALVAGGSGAVAQVNSLVTQIGQAGSAMGEAASSRLYQAGIDAARGLVAGLSSMDEQLDKAAERIGNRISSKIKQSLGIKSPSVVMMKDMEHVGSGLVKGLDRQHKKVESATARLGERISVSPEVAAYAARQGQPAAVSGNAPLFRDFVVQTPTEDPKAVAQEALNEMTARL